MHIRVADDGCRYSICLNPDTYHPRERFIGEPAPPPGRSARAGGSRYRDRLGNLIDCIPADGVGRSYGEAEDLLVKHYSEVADQLLRRYGPRWRGPEHQPTTYSTSAYLASRLRELEKKGHLSPRLPPPQVNGDTTGSSATGSGTRPAPAHPAPPGFDVELE